MAKTRVALLTFLVAAGTASPADITGPGYPMTGSNFSRPGDSAGPAGPGGEPGFSPRPVYPVGPPPGLKPMPPLVNTMPPAVDTTADTTRPVFGNGTLPPGSPFPPGPEGCAICGGRPHRTCWQALCAYFSYRPVALGVKCNDCGNCCCYHCFPPIYLYMIRPCEQRPPTPPCTSGCCLRPSCWLPHLNPFHKGDCPTCAADVAPEHP